MNQLATVWEAMGIRFLAAAVPLTLIASMMFFATPQNHWTFLMASATALGFIHFFVATTYQLKGIVRSPNRRTQLIFFAVLVGIALSVCGVLIWSGHTLLLGLLTIAYFVWHTLSNEHTFLSRAQHISIPHWSVISLLLPVGALYLVSLTHPSIFFDYWLQYPVMSEALQYAVMGTYVPVAHLSVVAALITLVFLFVTPTLLWWKYHARFASVGFALFGLLTLIIVATEVVVNFMYILHFVLVYHFTVLSLLFYKPMRAKGRRVFVQYSVLHLIPFLLLAPVVVVFMMQPDVITWVDYVLHYQVFVTVSVTHITASLLNETWFKNIFLTNRSTEHVA